MVGGVVGFLTEKEERVMEGVEVMEGENIMGECIVVTEAVEGVNEAMNQVCLYFRDLILGYL
jgi:hypothetical protein